MKIFSNGYPTNMPNAEAVSQGGPANFARLFSTFVTSNTSHSWVGIMVSHSKSKTIRIKKSFSFPQRDYFKFYLPKKYYRLITQANKVADPAIILEKPIKRLASLIKKENPDVVFLNGFSLFNWILLKAAVEAKVPIAIQHAGIWTKELNLYKHIYTKAGLKIMKQMEKDSTYLCSAEVFLNTWSRDYYQKHVAKKISGTVGIIPLPFDFASFASLPKSQKKSVLSHLRPGLKIGTIARWDRIKNHKAFLSLARAAKREGLPWQFYSVTKIPENTRFAASKKSYEKNIKVVRSLDRVGIYDFCRAMDLLILPSLFDVSPTVVLEAVSVKTPIVISGNVGYAHDFKESGAKDWVIDFKDIKKAKEKIKKIMQKPLPQTLQNQIKVNHGHEKVFLSYLNLFERITEKKEIMPVIAPDALSALELA